MNQLKRVFPGFLLLLIACFLLQPEPSSAESYGYDAAGRLINVTYANGASIKYSYDANGNILAKQVTLADPDLDSDGDGLADSIEIGVCPNINDADTDDDGILDGTEDANQNGIVDSGETNPCNDDTDGDGIQDGTELGLTSDDIGADTDTNIFQPDLDPVTQTNPLNMDSDGDGYSDGDEDKNYNGRVDAGESNPDDATSKSSRAMPWIPLLLLN